MKSKVLKEYALAPAVAAYSWQSQPDQHSAEESLYQIALSYKRYEAVLSVASGDVVAITMRSEHKKFNRTTKLQVGSNMFDKTLEEALIGKTVDTDYSLEHAEGKVEYRISDIQHLVVPSVTDEMAKAAGIADIETVAQLRGYYVAQGLKEQLYNEVYDFIPKFLAQWQFVLEEEDLYEMDELEMERCRGISRSMGMVFDEMTEEELLGAVGCPSIPAFREMIHQYHRKTLSAILIEAALSGQDSGMLSLADANKYYGALMERIVQCAMKQIQEEELC